MRTWMVFAIAAVVAVVAGVAVFSLGAALIVLGLLLAGCAVLLFELPDPSEADPAQAAGEKSQEPPA